MDRTFTWDPNQPSYNFYFQLAGSQTVSEEGAGMGSTAPYLTTESAGAALNRAWAAQIRRIVDIPSAHSVPPARPQAPPGARPRRRQP
jgi:hypothetical protein